MIVNGQTIKSLNTGFSAVFSKSFGDVVSQMSKIATVVPSTTKVNEYAWLGSFPQVREWVGDKVIKELSAHSYTIKNKKWENTIGVDKDDIEDDAIGIYTPMVQELGMSAASHPDELVFKALEDGDKQKCYDGQYFFDTDHQVAGSSVSNITSGASPKWVLLDTSRALKPIIFQERKKATFKKLSEDSEHAFKTGRELMGSEARYNVGYGFWQQAHLSMQALTEDNFNNVRKAMRGQKGDNGQPLRVKPTIIVIHPDLEATAEKLFALKTLSQGGDNPLYQKVEIIVADIWS